MKLSFRQVCIFWGVMDVLYLATYVLKSSTQGRIPFVDDIINFSALYSEQGGSYWLLILFILSMITTLSIVFSALLLLTAWNKVGYLVAAQTPLRLLVVVPSLTFLPWIMKWITPGNVAVALFLLLISEALKVSSVIISAKLNK